MNKNNKYYKLFILLLDLFGIVLWIYFLVQSFLSGSTIWTKLFWILMEFISIFNLYRDRNIIFSKNI